MSGVGVALVGLVWRSIWIGALQVELFMIAQIPK
jgi:hypothetical protein